MKVRRIHPDDLLEERRKELLAMTYEQRMTRHLELLEKIYPGKIGIHKLEGMKIKIRRGTDESV